RFAPKLRYPPRKGEGKPDYMLRLAPRRRGRRDGEQVSAIEDKQPRCLRPRLGLDREHAVESAVRCAGAFARREADAVERVFETDRALEPNWRQRMHRDA